MLRGSYAHKQELVAAVNRYAINEGVGVKLQKSEPGRVKGLRLSPKHDANFSCMHVRMDTML